MAEAAVTLLLDQVKEVSKEYADLISGAENEFSQLNNELNILKAIVKDVMKPKKKENLFRELERQIKEVVYEVEDAIDDGLTKAMEAKAKKSFRISLRSKRFSLAKLIKSIREEKVMPMLEEAKMKYALVISHDDFGSMEEQRSIIRKDMPIRQNRVIGFEYETEIITGYLKETTTDLDVISIVGIPGQGKTTLAWKIYQDDDICFLFPIRIWVHISQEFNNRDVFIQILRKFIPSQETSFLNDDELAQTVRACLDKEKFLLVVDDVWSVDAWNKIKEVLPLSNGEGKVLITSRAMDVGMQSQVYRAPLTLKFLQIEESWTLLQYEVFGNLEDCPDELRDIGKNIAIKCEGVPLTIIVIGGILIDQLISKSPSLSNAKEEWEMLLKYESEALQSDKAQRITDAVALSYHRLPDHLRECFLYLGVFPQDYEISAKTLCGLWISEGFILPERGRSLEESAEEKLNDLIYRNLLRVEKINRMGQAKTCRVPKMIRAFCIARSREENFFQEIKRSKTGELEPQVSEVQKFHRLCLHADLSKFISEKPCGSHVRSFLCFYKQPLELNSEHISVIVDGFENLRILESQSIKFDNFPAKLTKLIHLRYLTLYIETLKFLPEAITQLWNLQALVVETKSRSITMKANMWRMIRLRHLKTKAVIVLDDHNWEGEAGHNLQTLSRLAPESCTEAVSKRAKSLRTLGISGNLAHIFENKFLEKLLHLEELKMVNRVTNYELSPEDVLHRLPPTNCFPPNLKRLTLTNTFLGWQHMSTLAMIKSLEVLKLKDNAFVGVSWRVANYDFPSLQLLLMVNADLVIWEATPEAFPHLKVLVVKSCEKLKEIPECLGIHLQKLEIERVQRSTVKSAQNIEKIHMGAPTSKYLAPFKLIMGLGCL